MAGKSESRKGRGGRLLIMAVGVLILGYGVMLAALFFFGTRVEARLTSYRQQMGERNEVIPNRYTYHFGYTFTVDGHEYSGTGQRIAGPVYLKPGPEATIRVKYLPCCPRIHADDAEAHPGRRVAVFVAVGLLLLWFTRKML